MDYVFNFDKYSNKRLAVDVKEEDGCPYARLSINVETVDLEEDEFILNHDLNHPMFDDFKKMCLGTGQFEDTGKVCDYGFVRSQPIWRVVTKQRRQK